MLVGIRSISKKLKTEDIFVLSW